MLGGLLIIALGMWAIAMWSSFSDADGKRDRDLLIAERDDAISRMLAEFQRNQELLTRINRHCAGKNES